MGDRRVPHRCPLGVPACANTLIVQLYLLLKPESYLLRFPSQSKCRFSVCGPDVGALGTVEYSVPIFVRKVDRLQGRNALDSASSLNVYSTIITTLILMCSVELSL